MPEVRVRPLKTLEEFRACEEIQRAVWGTLGVSSEVLLVTQKHGGAVLGAFTGGRCVGFVYAFLARRHGRLIHWSHMMAVLPEFRDRGLGLRMKLAHRRLALQQGIRSVCWTFDPLQSRNAALNLRRLGAQAEEYIPDCYGQFPSAIEKGLPADRFVAHWKLDSAEVRRRLRQKAAPVAYFQLPRVNETRPAAEEGPERFLENHRIFLRLRSPRLLVEIPSNTEAMRNHALSLARRWRMESRQIFRSYFAAGYIASDFASRKEPEGLRCYYVLRRKPTAHN
jgi:predicted GNAT superfamily acetyltransferase